MEIYEYVAACGKNFNECIDDVKNIINSDDDSDESFNAAIVRLNMAREQLKGINNAIKGLKQDEHDITQDVYNKFKDKGFVKTIKF